MSGRVETVVVGAGPSGLAVSERLAGAGRDHVVLERGRVGDTWRTQRWDGFRLNTPGWMTGLPGDPDGFGTARDLVAALERRAAGLPVREGIAVRAVWRERGGGYLVAAGDEVIRAANVVAASGAQRVPRTPAIAASVAADVQQLHVAEYRNAAALADGAVLVVGSGQSGAQVAEDLLAAGRRVLVATSKVPRTPRRHRGRDITAWWQDMGILLDPPPADRPPVTQPLIAGGREISLQSLARSGAELLGRLVEADGLRLRFAGDPCEHAAYADAAAIARRSQIDEWIAGAGVDAAPAASSLQVDAPLRRSEAPLRPEIDLATEGVGAVIWATGFTGDFGWLRMPIHEPAGGPIHRGVTTPSPGLFVLGLPGLTNRMSGAVWGIEHDAALVADAIAERGGRQAAPAVAVAA